MDLLGFMDGEVEMADAHKSFIQDMLTETAKKRNPFQRHDFLLVIPVITPAESDTVWINLQDTVVRDRCFVRVSPQVLNHGFRPGIRIGSELPAGFSHALSMEASPLCHSSPATGNNTEDCKP